MGAHPVTTSVGWREDRHAPWWRPQPLRPRRSATFGIDWGLAGNYLGPAAVSLASGRAETASLVAGNGMAAVRADPVRRPGCFARGEPGPGGAQPSSTADAWSGGPRRRGIR